MPNFVFYSKPPAIQEYVVASVALQYSDAFGEGGKGGDHPLINLFVRVRYTFIKTKNYENLFFF